MSSSPPEDTDEHANGGVDLEDSDRPIVVERVESQAPKTSDMWIAAAYNVTAIIGVGVLGLPHAMVFLTWGPGVVILLLAFFITYFTMTQLIKLHEFELLNKGVRYDTYHSLGKRALGAKYSRLFVLPLQMVVEFGLDILFTVAAGEAMNRIHDKLTNSNPVHIFVWFAVFATIQIVLSFVVPTFDFLKRIVVIAAIMSICYSTIAWITIVSMCNNEDVHYRLPKHLTVDHDVKFPVDLTHRDLVFRAFNAIGVIAFAYAAHNVVLEIQNGIPSTPEKPSEKEMLRGVWITYMVVAMCFFPMGIAVYKKHGNQISQNILSFIQYHVEAPTALVIAANLMLIIHLVGSYQVFAQPVFKFLEDSFQIRRRAHFKRFSMRVLYIVSSTVIAMIFPNFSPLLGFFGGFAIAPTTYFLPCIIWLKINKQKRWKSMDWYINWACIILGVLLMIIASVGGLYVLIKESSIYDNWQLWRNDWDKSLLYSTKSITKVNCNPTPSHAQSPAPP